MSEEKIKKPFIPRNKPKSWVIFNLAGLCALLIVAPMMFASVYLKWKFLQFIGMALFICCWATGVAMWFVFFFGMITGKYKAIEERDWHDQLW
jgi:hypothetical protein